ncbi:hypothetical protein WME94_38000 [Sorangium sp. So ce429]
MFPTPPTASPVDTAIAGTPIAAPMPVALVMPPKTSPVKRRIVTGSPTHDLPDDQAQPGFRRPMGQHARGVQQPMTHAGETNHPEQQPGDEPSLGLEEAGGVRGQTFGTRRVEAVGQVTRS